MTLPDPPLPECGPVRVTVGDVMHAIGELAVIGFFGALCFLFAGG